MNVTYTITVEDNAGNIITSANLGYELGYQMVPEFTRPTMLALFVVVTCFTVAVQKARVSRYSDQSATLLPPNDLDRTYSESDS